MVVVAKVYPDTPADGELFTDDRIVGVDNKTLSMLSPNADLRKLLAESDSKTGPVLRVMREGKIIQVELSITETPVPKASLRLLPVTIASAIATTAEGINEVLFTVRPSGGSHYAAHVTLHLAEEPGPEKETDE